MNIYFLIPQTTLYAWKWWSLGHYHPSKQLILSLLDSGSTLPVFMIDEFEEEEIVVLGFFQRICHIFWNFFFFFPEHNIGRREMN